MIKPMPTIRCTDGERVKYLKTRVLPSYAELAIVDVVTRTVILEDPDKDWVDVYYSEPSLMWLVDECKKALST